MSRPGRSRTTHRPGKGGGFDPGSAYEPPVPTPSLPPLAGGSTGVPLTADRITDALRTVFDPELGLSVVELGLIYGIRIDEGVVTVTMTLTAPGCPIHDVMPEWVRKAVGAMPGVTRVEVVLTFDPPWSPARIRTPSAP